MAACHMVGLAIGPAAVAGILVGRNIVELAIGLAVAVEVLAGCQVDNCP